MPAERFNKTYLENLPITGLRYDRCDAGCKGLMIRVSAGGEKVFYFRYQSGKGRAGRTQKVRIGVFPSVTVDQARRRAGELAAQLVMGGDPAAVIREQKAAQTLGTVFDEFERVHLAKLKPRTRQSYRYSFDKYMSPSLGRYKLHELTTAKIQAFHSGLRDTARTANMCVVVLSSLYSWAARQGYVEKGFNPAAGVERFPEKRKESFLTVEQVRTLLTAIDDMERTFLDRLATKTHRKPGAKVDSLTTQTANIFRLIILTGARRAEIESLKWSYVREDEGRAYLPESKTGFRIIPLSEAALSILRGIPRISEYVFPTDSPTTKLPYQSNLSHAWKALREYSGIDVDIDGAAWRIHDLRHAFASLAVNDGGNIAVIGKVLGHRNLSTTMRYSHVARSPVQDMANRNAELMGVRVRPQNDSKAGNVLTYRGYRGTVDFDAVAGCLSGGVEGTNITYVGRSVDEVKTAFHEAVDALCSAKTEISAEEKDT